MNVFGGIDAGGTTLKCGVFDEEGTCLDEVRIPVTAPEETVRLSARFFQDVNASGHTLQTLGVASFGPIGIDPDAADYGVIRTTSKAGWSGVPLKQIFDQLLDQDTVINTDVNGALLAERMLGAAQNTSSAAYITVGTGIGAGIWASGGFLGFPSHPEFGHVAIARQPEDSDFESVCPFHSDCLEGHASARAFESRFGDATALAPDHPGWELEANYLAQACRSLYLTVRPDRIILGGGLMQAQGLIGRIRSSFSEQLSGYADTTADIARNQIVAAGLGDQSGMVGGMLIGKNKQTFLARCSLTI